MKKETLIKLRKLLSDKDILDIEFKGCPSGYGFDIIKCNYDIDCKKCWLESINKLTK